MFARLALRNVFRQKLRSAVTITSIVFGVTGLIVAGGFVQDIIVQLGEATIHSQTGHIQVFRRGFLALGTRQPEKFLIQAPEKLTAKIALTPEVAEVMQRLNFSGLLNNGRRDLGIIGEGVEPDKESRLGTHIRIAAGRQLTANDHFGILIGQGVALSLGLNPGDKATILISSADGALNTQDFEVIGIFQSFSKEFDARAVRISLAAAQELLANQGANLLVVRLHNTQDSDRALTQILAQLNLDEFQAMGWRDLSDFYEKTIQLYDRQFGVLQAIILCMVLLSVTNSINMTTFERTSEFGTLRALGNQPKTVFLILLCESTFLGITGAAIGTAVGISVAAAVSAIGIDMPPLPNTNLGYTGRIAIVPSIVLQSAAIGFVATVLASLLPARKVVRMPVVDALRQSV